MRIPDGSSVFTAEAKAIDLALDFVNTCTYTDKFVIFSDSLSVLQALNHTSSKNSQRAGPGVELARRPPLLRSQ